MHSHKKYMVLREKSTKIKEHPSSEISVNIKKFFLICLHSSRFVYTRLHSSRIVYNRLVTCLHSSTFVQTRLVTRLYFQNRSLDTKKENCQLKHIRHISIQQFPKQLIRLHDAEHDCKQSAFLSLRLEGEKKLKYHCVCQPLSVKMFSIASNDHGRTHKYHFSVSDRKYPYCANLVHNIRIVTLS